MTLPTTNETVAGAIVGIMERIVWDSYRKEAAKTGFVWRPWWSFPA